MRCNIYNKVHAIGAASLLLLLTACQSDWENGIPDPKSGGELGFAASVVPSETVTRADGSLVNRLETSLFKTDNRTYYDSNGDPHQAKYSVGVFAYNTEASPWSNTATANFMFNQKMDIGDPDANGRNPLYYATTTTATEPGVNQDSLRYWPNHRDGTTGQYDHKLSFWAYYPWNATEDPGTYGSGISPTDKTAGTVHYGIKNNGMGAVRFVMHPDASEQSDFMMSDLVAECTREQYPLNGTVPTPVPLRFHHLLAQVRIYAFIRGTDKVVYAKDGDKTLKVTAVTSGSSITLSSDDGVTFTEYTSSTSGMTSFTTKYVDASGVTKELTVGDSIPDDTPWLKSVSIVTDPKTVRWKRDATTKDVTGTRYRADVSYSMAFNNIHTECVFTPNYNSTTGKTTFSYQDVGTLGSATVNNYIMNPYWFRFKDGERVMLNDNYMYDYFETTAAAKGVASVDGIDGVDWLTKGVNPLKYISDSRSEQETKDPDYTKSSSLPRYEGINTYETLHFNYAPGNILLCVPQVMNDNDVPHIVLEGKSKQVTYSWDGSEYVATETDNAISGKVTVNMLNMNLKWESGFIYCYAFVDELQPGDDKVKGPESIQVVFDPTKHTDQW